VETKVITGDIEKIKADAVIINCFDGGESLSDAAAVIDKALDGAITQLISLGEIKGKQGEITFIHSLGKLPSAQVVVLGLGKRSELDKDRIRSSVAAALRQLRQKGAKEIGTIALGMGINGISAEDSAQAIAEGSLLGLYSFRKHITKKPDYPDINQLTLVEPDAGHLTALTDGCEKGKIIAEAANLTRDMVNESSNYLTPADMAKVAKELAESNGLKINIFDREQMRELGMGALLGVSQGSDQPPKFIVLRYKGNDDTERLDVALVGKGITFDSGGISLKPADGMGEMKGDMAGGATVMAVIKAVSRLRLKTNIIAVIPATENMPGGHSFKPGDILNAMNGKTIEIITTDAEGRLILADALAYTKTFDVGCIIDIATLTGACHVALGDVCTGVFGNNQELINKVIAAGRETGELMWQMPMFDQYKELNKSDVADIKNSGGRWGGAITAAKFLEEFVGGTPWVHLDIAGTSDTEKEQGYVVKGGTGVPVRTLIALIAGMAK